MTARKILGMSVTNYLVMWSGGVDSTYLIQYLLDNSNDTVCAVYARLVNNKAKIKMELAAIKKMVPILKEKYGSRFTYWKNGSDIHLSTGNHATYVQPLVWAFCGLLAGNNIDKVAIGYVLGDDAISYIPDLVAFRNAISQFCNPLPELCFPLIKHHKKNVYDWLHAPLRKLAVWCENPSDKDFKHCGKCNACRDHKFYGVTRYGAIL
jgi:7-cyano-7-deazaguanine synthase in queuosine biosynthesis